MMRLTHLDGRDRAQCREEEAEQAAILGDGRPGSGEAMEEPEGERRHQDELPGLKTTAREGG